MFTSSVWQLRVSSNPPSTIGRFAFRWAAAAVRHPEHRREVQRREFPVRRNRLQVDVLLHLHLHDLHALLHRRARPRSIHRCQVSRFKSQIMSIFILIRRVQPTQLSFKVADDQQKLSHRQIRRLLVHCRLDFLLDSQKRVEKQQSRS